jgi:hypothetical protein
MNVRRRNQLVLALHTVLYCIPLVIFGWVMWQAEGPDHPVLTAAVLAGEAVFLTALLLWMAISNARSVHDLEGVLRQSGLDPAPEEPMPVVPRLRVAANRNELIAGVLFFVLLALVFVAYYAGWIERWMAPPPRR